MYDFRKTLFSVLIAVVSLITMQGQNPSQASNKLNIGLYESPPFVMLDANKPEGLAVDLWEYIAKEQNLNYSYKTYNSFKEILNATTAKEIDVAVTNLTITENRARSIDFTQPWYDAGLRIMVDDENRTTFSALIKGLNDAGHLSAYLWLLFIIIIVTVALTFFDRQFDKEFPKKVAR